MAIDKIQTAGLGENIEIGGTEAAKMPVGTTAERANVQAGDIRFNSTLSLMEYYDGTIWKAIDSPPTIGSISPSTFTADGDTITVNGTNFQIGANITVTGSDGTTYTPDSVTRVSSSQVTFDITTAIFNGGLDAFDVTVTNTSGLGVTSADALTIPNPTAAFNSSASSTLYDSGRSSGFDAGVTLSGDVSESDVTVSYALTTGTLPSGASLNTSTGAITGISSVGSDTTSNFTITATVADASEGTSVDVSRAFALTVAAPIVTSYTSTGFGTFSVPTGLTVVDVLVVAGGGAGGGGAAAYHGGGGGAGGLIFRPQFPVSGQISYTVGSGGTVGNPGASAGQDSAFGTLTAKGGGGGSSESGSAPIGQPKPITALAGGSGGGQSYGGPGQRGPATQPSQPGDSGTYGFGNDGGLGGGQGPGYPAGGGGGAGGVGEDGQTPGQGGQGGDGGVGKQYDISGSQVYYAGGGGAYNPSPGQGGGQGGSGGGGAGTQNSTGGSGNSNRGGGGGGSDRPASGGTGGSGIVIVKY